MLKPEKCYQRVVKEDDVIALSNLIISASAKLTDLLTGNNLPRENGEILVDTLHLQVQAARLRGAAKVVHRFAKTKENED